MPEFEETRAIELLAAQSRAQALFREVEERRLIRPGITEGQLNAEIYALLRRCTASQHTDIKGFVSW